MFLKNVCSILGTPAASNRQVRRNALMFYNVTQDDSQVIQCNVSNVYGYRWADVFMQVVGKCGKLVLDKTSFAKCIFKMKYFCLSILSLKYFSDSN